ncbi:HlyD family efflux transporter periplasmic adaptor subunit [Streptacidiphilus anmyonensis]|uniref:HlyD family efflux transporter periplasmic adaptor subunit n=1 Tax=Streptacidiphilus anmyonensis TaxID=405782 RepID=UPI0005A6576C|nr:HlyD family efflux transporter periplasmic adaptor subunit [Streptacidiphilus anmyonensis]
MQFRQQALAKQQSPEDLDVPAQLARPQGRLVLLVTAAVVAAAGFWAVTGTVSTKADAPGILFHAEGSYTLESPVAGQVVAVYASAGDTLAAGAPLLGVRTGSSQKVQMVRTVSAGRITTLSAPLGSVVATGSGLATVERVTSPDEPLVAVLYASATTASSIPVGAEVDLTVQSVPVQQYGLLRGKVQSVGRSPESQQQIAGFLGSDQLAQAFSTQGEPVPVVVQLERYGSSRSGYAWSTTQGPPYQLQSTELVSAAVHLAGQHPIDWILP